MAGRTRCGACARRREGAADLFAVDSYWRDLVAFTWNITTAEGNAEVRKMIAQAVIPAGPSAWQLEGEAGEANGVIEGWIRFETEVARGCGHVRLIDGKAWTLLTTMSELKGYEERRGPTRDRGAEFGVRPGRKTWLEQRRQEEAELGYLTQPYVVIVGGGQGGIALAARLRRLNVPTIIIETHARPATPGGSVTRASTCTIRSGTTIFPTCRSPITGRCSARRTRSRTGWRCTRSDGAELLGQHRMQARALRRREAGVDGRSGAQREPLTLRPRQLVLATGSLGVPNMPSVPGMERFQGTCTIAVGTLVRMATGARRRW